MICLDTNYLILGLVRGSGEAERIMAWSETGERFCVSAVVWYEFMCGPVTSVQVVAMRSLVDEIVPFDHAQAEQAARLFNAVGRNRQLRVDAMIAAAAVSRNAAFATADRDDFSPFVVHGLRLV
jgi:predicted nucleic acid-binding protein